MRPIFYEGAASKVILTISEKNNYMSKICKQGPCGYSYLTKTLTELKKMGIVELNNVGRKKFVTLTKKGEEIKQLLIKLKFLVT